MSENEKVDPVAIGEKITGSILAYTALVTTILAAVGPAAEALKSAASPILVSLRENLNALVSLVKQRDLLNAAGEADVDARLKALDKAIEEA